MGHPSTDRACFGNDDKHCIGNLSFITVVKSADLASLRGSGLIGLGPTPEMYFDTPKSDPLKSGTEGFVAQLAQSADYRKDFEPMFSFYLTNDEKSKGKMIFGGYDLKWAKPNSEKKDIFWMKQSGNTSYWAVNGDKVQLGAQTFSQKPQQIILDNGMSFAMAPEKTFADMVVAIQKQTGIQCFESKPVWGCMCDSKSYDSLPNLRFNMVADESGKSKVMDMPKESYMMHK